MALTPAQQIAVQRETGGGVNVVYAPQQTPTSEPAQPSQPAYIPVTLSPSEERLVSKYRINLSTIDRRNLAAQLIYRGVSSSRAWEIARAENLQPEMRVSGASRAEQQQIATYSTLRAGGLSTAETKQVISSGTITYEQAKKLTPQVRSAVGVDYFYAQQERLSAEQKLKSEIEYPAPTEAPKEVQQYFESRIQTKTVPAVKETAFNLGFIKIEKTITPEKTYQFLNPTYATFEGTTWTTEGFKEEVASAWKPSVLQPVTSIGYLFGKLDKSISGYEERAEYGVQYEERHPIISKGVRFVGSYIDMVAPFIYFAPALATLPKIKPVAPKPPKIISQESYIYKGKLHTETTVKIPRTYVKVEGALGVTQRVQVSPTVIKKTSIVAPITRTAEGNLIIRGAVREQRILPTQTRFTEYRGYDTGVRGKTFIEHIKPLEQVGTKITRARVSSIVVPTQSQYRVYSDRIWVREAGIKGGKSLTIKSTGEKILKIPTPDVMVVASKQKPIISKVLYGNEIVKISQMEARTGTLTWTRYGQASIKVKPFDAKVVKSNLNIFKTTKPSPVFTYEYIPKRYYSNAGVQEFPTDLIQRNIGEQLTRFVTAPPSTITVTSFSAVTPATSGLFLAGLVPRTTPVQPSVQMDITKVKTAETPLPRQTPIQKITPVPVVIPTPRVVTPQVEQLIQPTPQPKPQPTPIIPKTPKIEIIPRIEIPKTTSMDIIKKARSILSTGYKTFVYRGGKKIYLSGISPRTEAIKKGEKVTLGTLAARFGIEETKIGLRTPKTRYEPSERIFRGYKIRGKSRIPLKEEWIELAGTKREPTIKKGARLGSMGEVSEIMSFQKRKKKGGSFFGL